MDLHCTVLHAPCLVHGALLAPEQLRFLKIEETTELELELESAQCAPGVVSAHQVTGNPENGDHKLSKKYAGKNRNK